MRNDFQDNSVAVLEQSPAAVVVAVACRDQARKPASKQDQFNQDIANSPFHDRAVAAFDGYTGAQWSYQSALPGYYRDYQANALGRACDQFPHQIASIRHLFVASFVAGADADIAASYGISHRDVPVARGITDRLVEIVASCWDDQDERDCINARLSVEHEMSWIGQLAHREGRAKAALIL